MTDLTVKKTDEDLRVDKFLCKKFDISFAIAQKLIRQKKVKINGNKIDYSYKIQEGDGIKIFSNLEERLEKEKPKISSRKIQNFFQSKIYEDKHIIAIDKPSGISVQGGTNIEISIDDFLAGGLQLVHRLDKDTSGILLIAKNKEAAKFLTEKFKNKTIKKTYIALVYKNLKKESGEINIPLRKKFIDKDEKVRPDFEEGKEAITKYKLIKNYQDHAEVELIPITGRTHQLRVHFKEIGHPIINDVKYGGKKVINKNLSKRLCLHAKKIEIDDYFGKTLKIESKRPDFL